MNKKFCVHCGAEVNPQAVVCVHCGCGIPGTNAARTFSSSSDSSDIMKTLIKVFTLIGVVANAFALIPLIWCIPMYQKVNRYLKGEETLTTGFKVCVLLFVNVIAGILLLVDEN